jgi:hypothetical protein
MFTELKEQLDSLLKSVPYVQQSSIEDQIRGYYWTKSEHGLNFLKSMQSIPQLDKFNNKYQQLGSGSSRVHHVQLANWIINRALYEGSEKTLNDLRDYLVAKEIRLYQILIASGFYYTGSPIKFGNGVELVEVMGLSNRRFIELLRDNFSYERPSHVLVIPFNQPVHHFDDTGHEIASAQPEQELEDVKLCISLAVDDCSLQSLSRITIPTDDQPILGQLWYSSPLQQKNVLRVNLGAEDIERAKGIFEKFNQLPDKLKARFRISIDRLNGFNSFSPDVDKAIDLRIALESIFLDDNNKTELQYRLRLRAARFLGESVEDRVKLFNLFKEAYDSTSAAVHNGKIDAKKMQGLEIAARFGKKAIIKMIEAGGEINWQEIELGS